MDNSKTQADNFQQAAREMETKNDPQCFKDKLKKQVKHKPVEKSD